MRIESPAVTKPLYKSIAGAEGRVCGGDARTHLSARDALRDVRETSRTGHPMLRAGAAARARRRDKRPGAVAEVRPRPERCIR